jgi:hypothetical protein
MVSSARLPPCPSENPMYCVPSEGSRQIAFPELPQFPAGTSHIMGHCWMMAVCAPAWPPLDAAPVPSRGFKIPVAVRVTQCPFLQGLK